MSRLKDAVLGANTAYTGHAPVLDLTFGGQNGRNAAIGRSDGTNNYAEWISNQAYVRQNIIPIVLAYPKAYDLLDEPAKTKMIDTYNALMTIHPMSIEGLQSGLSVEFAEHAIGAAGEMQHEITKTSRAVSTLSMNFNEKAGKAIQKFIDWNIRYLYSDPDVEKPLISNLYDFGTGGNTGAAGMYTPDFYTGTVLYIEPDVTQQHVNDSWLMSNIMFKGNGDRTGKRDIHSARETLDLSIECTGLTMSNENVDMLADTMLKQLNVLVSNPTVAMTLPQGAQETSLAANANNSNQFDSVPAGVPAGGNNPSVPASKPLI